jgi:branched-chain amino acid transport system ATP-binding protein
MLDVRHLRVSYGPTEVLRDVSFAIEANSIVALLGGNGSGKSTTLNVLSGLVTPQAGEVMLDGRRVDGLSSDRLVSLGVVQVPQGREIWGGMTVRDNLELGAARRRDRKAIAADADEVLELFPVLRAKQRNRAGTLSGGEQQMLAVARALMARPRVLLLDEPSAGLAPVVVGHLVDTVRALHARGLTILLVEQNVGVAAALADRAHVLVNGEIAVSGPAADLLTNPEVLRSYLG